jgi:SAM-dependent methyltransferase
MKSVERFTDRVADYAKYRPHYPQAVFDMLRDGLGFRPGAIVADVGSGTGISTKPLLELGCTVYAVEPNNAMRRAAEQWLGEHPRFRSVAGTAEETTLAEHSVDAIIAAQAFHWFDATRARREFDRILRPNGWIVLVWNDRVQSGQFYAAYESLIREFATDYDQVRARGKSAIESDLCGFFGGAYQVKTFENDQRLDFEKLKGLLLSASYIPGEGHPSHTRMIAQLRDIYERFASGGAVQVLCSTNVYFGQLAAAGKRRASLA